MYVHLVFACSVALALGARAAREHQHQAFLSPSSETCTKEGGCGVQGIECFVSCDLKLAAPGACRVKRTDPGQQGVCRAIRGSAACTASERWLCPANEICHEGVGCRACAKKLEQSPACVVEALREAAHITEFGGGPDNLFPGYSRATQANPDQVNDVLESASSNLRMIGQESSRSGASFFITDSKDYLIKGMARGSEYKELDKLSKMSFEADTVLNIPVIAFPAFGNFWCVMPSSDYDFHQKLGLHPFGDVQVMVKSKFDIKPQPLISKDRAKFFDHARSLMLSEGALLTGRMEEFHQALYRDLAVLTAQELVDYSWLIYMYQVPYGAVTVPDGTWCFVYTSMHKTKTDFKVAPSHDNVICFSLIDYSLRYDPAGSYFKRAENKIMGEKWTQYDAKFVRLTQCIFSVPETDAAVQAELQLSSLRTQFIGVQQRKKAVVTIFTARPYTEAECSDYRADQCKGVVSVTKAGKGECDAVIELWKDSFVISPQRQASYCKQYMVEQCLALLK